jgi:hypothetical protein
MGRAGRSLDRRLEWNIIEKSKGSQAAVEDPPYQSKMRSAKRVPGTLDEAASCCEGCIEFFQKFVQVIPEKLMRFAKAAALIER